MMSKKAVRIANGGLVPLEQLPVLDYNAFADGVLAEFAGGSRAARCGQPERPGPVMKFGAEMLVAARAKSMLK